MEAPLCTVGVRIVDVLHRGRSFVAGRRLHARELALGPCEGILIHYAGFKLWRERLRCAGILDTYQQLGYDVYQVLQTLAAEKKQPLLFRQFWNLTPLAHDVALERADEIPLRQSEAYDDAARAADIIISTRDLDVTLPAGWGRDELIRAKLIWTCNSHAFGPDGLDCGCFPGIARALNHSCDPNCRVSVDGDGRLSVFAGDREIQASEELCQSYVSPLVQPGEEEEDAAVRRRRYLQEHFFFTCDCERCLYFAPLGV